MYEKTKQSLYISVRQKSMYEILGCNIHGWKSMKFIMDVKYKDKAHI